MQQIIPYLPLLAIVGPIVGALIGAAITYIYVVKRKRATFYVHRTDDLSVALHQHQSLVVLRIGNADVLNLNRALVSVKNTGNSAILNFEFDIEIPGEHTLGLAEKVTDNAKLYEAIEIAREENRSVSYNPVFKIKVPFFNADERFDISLLFDKSPNDVLVHCRMEDLITKRRDADFINSNAWQAAAIRGILSGLGGIPPRLFR